MALSKRNRLSKTVLWYLLLITPLCNITTKAICHGFVLKRAPTLEAFLSRRNSAKKGFSKDHPRMNNFTKRSNTERNNHNQMYAHGKKKGKNKEALLQMGGIMSRHKLSTGDDDDDDEDDDDEADEGMEGKGNSNPRPGQQRNTQKNQRENMGKETWGGKNKVTDLYLRNNIKIKSSLKEEEQQKRQGDGVHADRDTEEELLSNEEDLTEDASSMENTSLDDEDEQDDEEPVTEEDLDTLNKTCAEKMESVYNYIKKESYRFNLSSISNTMFENEKIKINDQILIIKHISHIKKKENLFMITPFDPYYVNFIYNHFVKEYKELKFYVKDRSVYAVVPPLSENLKNEIRIKIKEKIEDSKATLRNVRKQMLTKLDKMRGRIGKDIYFMQRNHIQSLHDQTRKRIEAILNELR
ncbi:ribosome-recycling factor, putative [Plasmodium knowlesi strain H]|uniref:Ribosome-recycling factor, putative n=3 Tax=Plasmodium knowlesi TaxID=5850 RepID=A0A5K1UTJ6_PLAKH|nr:ribosome-recycling factor, putative [Plasmodium knowlesi strain H]OTN66641.1 putative Ribosome releasing factor [Plasmodium knowlesi]CAA9986765.1 ribosome-recycling factor, putative [Plasmodium knowlesi strain H]SBO23595.1 ribosome-recycling factor, putative [Plasmodium knowlesi strain H]SBO25148.1 ribosome-recycling factor, putative [Plasmodium knowlesi strain H]VVS76239.1 ribosome-recycling factor, putative [Plasmodium knowlesi strain H]|eukprot:XP_002257949.1 ribosome releasing factor, putative [Plasmodium knowlesi strain H]